MKNKISLNGKTEKNIHNHNLYLFCIEIKGENVTEVML